MKTLRCPRIIWSIVSLCLTASATDAHEPVYARKGMVVAQEPLAADGRTAFIDFREEAPRQATHDMYLDADGKLTRASLIGWRAAGVPGTVRGLELAQKKYGRQSWAELLQPAIELASKGFPVSHWMMQSLRASAESLSQFPDSKLIFLKGGAFYDWNEILRQPDLARTLERIAREGAKDFY